MSGASRWLEAPATPRLDTARAMATPSTGSTTPRRFGFRLTLLSPCRCRAGFGLRREEARGRRRTAADSPRSPGRASLRTRGGRGDPDDEPLLADRGQDQ